MRMTPENAFVEWLEGDMLPSLPDPYPRFETIVKNYTGMVKEDLEYAFQAGWNSAIMNLTTSDI